VAAFAADPRLPYVVSTIAGTPGEAGLENGPAAQAKFNRPTWLDVARTAIPYSYLKDGDIFVVDRANHVLRKISQGTVSTYAVGQGFPTNAPFLFDFGGPFGGGILIEPPDGGCGGAEYDRGMFVASSGFDQVALVSFVGILGNRDGHTILGMADTPGSHDGSELTALFDTPTGLARSPVYDRSDLSSRALYIADTGNHTIRRVGFSYSFEGCPQATSVGTLAGMAGVAGSTDGKGSAARFNSPRGIVTAPDGSLYVADSGNHTIRRIATDGTVTTIAGEAGVPGSDAAHLNTPSGIDINARGEIFICDTGNHVIRMLTTDGQLVTLAGLAGVAGHADGVGSDARFSGPVGIRVLKEGALVVADTSNQVIRLLRPADLHRRSVRH
jgi:hypothetical protein